jgi:H/ACA ribonucleoprotein complex subunit 4
MMTQESVLPAMRKRKRFVKISSSTDPHYGKKPVQRTMDELVQNGFFIVDKPSGPTSHQVVAWVKEIFNVEKAGHSGTLDPDVTGVLPIALNDATRALQALLFAGKEYVALMKLHKKVGEKKVREVCQSFVGEITQMPPIRSAVKRQKRKRQVYYLDVLEVKGAEVLFRVGCEAGTYIRTLCVDIGKKLGCGAQLKELRRTKVGHLSETNAVPLQSVRDAMVFWDQDGDESSIRSMVHPVEIMVGHLPKLVVRDSAIDALCHGADLAVPGVVEVDSDIKRDDSVVVLSLKGEAVALVIIKLSSEQILELDSGICASLERVLMKKGTYPSLWKKS